MLWTSLEADTRKDRLGDSAPEEGVRSALATDGRIRSVTRMHQRRVGQGRQLPGDRVLEGPGVSAGKVGAAHPQLEQRVPTEQVAASQQTAAARRVPRRM